MFDEDDYASLFLADDPLLRAGYTAKSPHSHLPSSAAADDAAGFSLFPFHLPPSAPSPSTGSSSAQSDSADSSSRSAPSPSAASVYSATTGAEATLLAAPAGGVDDLFDGGLAGFGLDGSGGPVGQSTSGGWAGDFGFWGASASQDPIAGGSPSEYAFAPSPSTGSNASHPSSTDGAYAQQQQQVDPFFDGLDLTGFALPPLPDDLAARGAPTTNNAFLPGPPTSFRQQASIAQPSQHPQLLQHAQQSQATGAIPSFVLSHIENNQTFPATASATALPGSSSSMTSTGKGLPASTVSPGPTSAPASAPLKRKASSSGGSSGSPTAAAGAKPVSDHNAIERKYRDNIQDAHLRLRDSVPVLRVLFNTTTPVTALLDTPSPATGLIDGQVPETKQGKATVLTAAREYIFLLQQSRAAERRFSAWLEDRIGGRGLRGEWEVEDEGTELEDGYLRAIRDGSLWRSFPHYADQDEDGTAGGPKRKKARSGAPAKLKAAGAAGKGKGGAPVGAKEAGKVMLALGLGLGVGLPLTSTSSAAVSTFDLDGADDDAGAIRKSGRIIGRTLLRRSPVASTPSTVPAWSVENVLSALALFAAAWLVFSVVRRITGVVSRSRAAQRAARIESALRLAASVDSESAERATDESAEEVLSLDGGLTLKQALGVDSTFAVVRKLVGTTAPFRWLSRQAPAMSENGDRERWAWVSLAEQSLAIPTDLSSYLLLLFLARRLAAFVRSGASSSVGGPPQADQHILLAVLSHALAGAPAQPPAEAVKHWSHAQASVSDDGSGGDAEEEILKLSLVEACAVCPEIFTSAPTDRQAGVKARIGNALALRDLKALWADVFGALAPRSSRPMSSAASSQISSTTATPHDAGHPFGHLLTNPLAPAHRASLALELAALERATSPASAAWELVVVSRAIWAVMERDTAGLEAGVLCVLGGEKGRGRQHPCQAALALLAFAGVKAAGVDNALPADVAPPSSTDLLLSELNLTLSFLLGYFASVALLSIPPASALAPNKPLLQATLRARAVLHQLDTLAAAAAAAAAAEDDDGADSDEDEGDESARERFGAVLYSVGRWAVGWKDEREDDSGFEDGF